MSAARAPSPGTPRRQGVKRRAGKENISPQSDAKDADGAKTVGVGADGRAFRSPEQKLKAVQRALRVGPFAGLREISVAQVASGLDPPAKPRLVNKWIHVYKEEEERHAQRGDDKPFENPFLERSHGRPRAISPARLQTMKAQMEQLHLVAAPANDKKLLQLARAAQRATLADKGRAPLRPMSAQTVRRVYTAKAGLLKREVQPTTAARWNTKCSWYMKIATFTALAHRWACKRTICSVP